MFYMKIPGGWVWSMTLTIKDLHKFKAILARQPIDSESE